MAKLSKDKNFVTFVEFWYMNHEANKEGASEL